jgi:NADH-quinone oxidoreductase subunit E/NADP-reducing hydrogenase subunit HndA
MKTKKLNDASLKLIDEIVEKHKDEMGPVVVMLHDVQNALGYVPIEAMKKIGDGCGVSAANVYGVVTFYTQFTTEPKGKHVINVCMGTACYVKGSQDIVTKMIELTKAKLNGTSDDGLFSLDATRCLGACGLAPVVVIDDRVYGNANDTNIVDDTVKALVREERGN